MITADDWLVDLARMGEAEARVAVVLLRTQTTISHRYGHIIDLSRGTTRNAIRGAARYGLIAKSVVPCMRCGCVATLTQWVTWAAKPHHERKDTVARYYEAGLEHTLAYGIKCRGDAYAVELDEAVNAYTHDEE